MLKKIKNKIKYLRRCASNPAYQFSHRFFSISKDYDILKSLHNKHSGKRCFIIGNGPSLNLIDLTKLKNEYTFGVNAIYTNYEKMGFYPTYYAVEDIFVAEDRAHEINDFKQSLKFFPNYLKHCIKRDAKTVFINFVRDFDENQSPGFSTDSSLKVYFGGTVSYVCMQLAYYMGFSEVYLVGFDHNYKVLDSVKKSGADFLSTEEDVNHFSPDYFGKGKRWHDPQVERMETSYLKAIKFFDADKRKIRNATAGGKLEVFERIDFEKVFM